MLLSYTPSPTPAQQNCVFPSMILRIWALFHALAFSSLWKTLGFSGGPNLFGVSGFQVWLTIIFFFFFSWMTMEKKKRKKKPLPHEISPFLPSSLQPKFSLESALCVPLTFVYLHCDSVNWTSRSLGTRLESHRSRMSAPGVRPPAAEYSSTSRTLSPFLS